MRAQFAQRREGSLFCGARCRTRRRRNEFMNERIFLVRQSPPQRFSVGIIRKAIEIRTLGSHRGSLGDYFFSLSRHRAEMKWIERKVKMPCRNCMRFLLQKLQTGPCVQTNSSWKTRDFWDIKRSGKMPLYRVLFTSKVNFTETFDLVV